MKKLTFFRLVIMCNFLFLSFILIGCSNVIDEEDPAATLPINDPSDPNDVETNPDDSLLPLIHIETTRAQPIESDEVYTSCKITLSSHQTEYSFTELTAGIRLRGNSTKQFDKKPYRIKFETDIQLLGLGNGPSKLVTSG